MRKRASLRRVMPEMGLDQPWAIRPEASRLIEQQLQRFAEHPRELAERFAIATEQWEKRNADPFGDGPGYENIDGVALIRFEGVVTKALSFWGWLLGGSASTEVLIETLKNAETDVTVKAVCLRMDTPGGLSRGVHLAANAVFDFRTKKAIWGLVSDCCASAGYYIGSQCTKLYAESDTAEVGSIGTLMSYWDYSQALAANGVKVDVIRSSPLKGTGTFGTSLTPDQRAYLQATVDTLTAKFKATVARGRGFSPEQIDLVSDGRCWAADEALTLGLIDGVSTLEALIGPLQAEPPVVIELAPAEPPESDDCDDDETEASKTTPEPIHTDRADSAARDGAPAAQAEAPKESEMNEDEIRKLIDGAVAPLQGENAALKAELAALKAQSDSTAKDVTATKAEQGLSKLLADARGENGGPVKLAAKDEITAGYLRTVYETKGAEAAQALLGTLPVIGNGTRTAAQQADAMGASTKGARHAADLIANRSAFDGSRLEVHDRVINHMRENGMDGKPGDYAVALAAVTRRRTELREVEIA